MSRIFLVGLSMVVAIAAIAITNRIWSGKTGIRGMPLQDSPHAEVFDLKELLDTVF
jgi:hypothetical protein